MYFRNMLIKYGLNPDIYDVTDKVPPFSACFDYDKPDTTDYPEFDTILQQYDPIKIVIPESKYLQ